MSYQSVVEMAASSSLQHRITAAAAAEGITDAPAWVVARIWKFAATPGWADSWAYARDTATINVNPDTGVRDDVINDTEILSAVQAMRAAEQPSAG